MNLQLQTLHTVHTEVKRGGETAQGLRAFIVQFPASTWQ